MGAAAFQCCKDEAEHVAHVCFLSEDQPSVPWDTINRKGVDLDVGSAAETMSLSDHSGVQIFHQNHPQHQQFQKHHPPQYEETDTYADEEEYYEETEEERAKREHEEYMASPMGVFVRQMMMGVAVTLVTHPRGDKQTIERTPAVCKIDEELANLSLECKGTKLACQVNKIQEVLHVEKDGEDVFPSTVVALLTPDELDRLVMVYYSLANGARKAFIFLEPSVESRRRFRDFLKVLHVHARSAAENDEQGQLEQQLSKRQQHEIGAQPGRRQVQQ